MDAGREHGFACHTPKSMGEIIRDVSELNNGDGISFFNADGEYEGAAVNGVDRGRIIGSRAFRMPRGAEIHRTFDRCWQTMRACFSYGNKNHQRRYLDRRNRSHGH